MTNRIESEVRLAAALRHDSDNIIIGSRMTSTLHGGGVTPQLLSWTRAIQDVSGISLDSAYVNLHNDIEGRSKLLEKSTKLKVKAWLAKLSEETINVVWKKNRNAYAKLLVEQLRAGRLEAPFHVLPPGSPLPTLPKSLTYAYSKARSPTRRRNLTPSQELDEYMGHHGRPPAALHSMPADSATPSPRRLHLSGMHVQTDGSASRQESGSRFQPSTLELEAELGASREREAELAWRLARAEDQVRRQGQVLNHSVATGSALPAVSQMGTPVRHHEDAPGSAATPSNAMMYNAEEISQLLTRAEGRASSKLKHRQRELSSSLTPLSTKPPLHSAAEASGSGAESEGREEMAAALASFEQRTGAIKRQLGADHFTGSPSCENGRMVGEALGQQSAPCLLPPFTGTMGQLWSLRLDTGGVSSAPVPLENAQQEYGQQDGRPGSAGSGSRAGWSTHPIARSPIGPAVRQTLKSAAAAAAGRGSAEAAMATGPKPFHPRPRSASQRLSPLLALPGGSTVVLAADVAGLKQRIVKSLSAMGSPAVDVASISGAGSPALSSSLSIDAHSTLRSFLGGAHDRASGLSSHASPAVGGSLGGSGMATPASSPVFSWGVA